MTVRLDERDRALLAGAGGDGAAIAMRILVEMADVVGADRLIDVASAHVDSCLYHGIAGLEFAERLAGAGARVRVPTTLNVSSLDLLHRERPTGLGREDAERARRQMDAYVAMGCRPTWTCAPYQLPERPTSGEHVAWAESNAIVFCNSVLGARTDRYGDFIDACAAITGRAPFAGLHRDDERRATLALRLVDVPRALLDSDALYPTLGTVLGREAGTAVAAIVGLPSRTSEDRLKALGAAAASSGAVAMFHAVGITPEAPTLEAATGAADVPTIDVGPAEIRAARDLLSTGAAERLGGVSLGTPHASLAELGRIDALLGGARPAIPLWVNTGRDVLAEAERRGIAQRLTDAGVRIVTDTCNYLTPMLRPGDGPVMTDSAKWAWYAPANLGVDVVFGGMEECVRSAIEGRVVRDAALWGDG